MMAGEFASIAGFRCGCRFEAASKKKTVCCRLLPGLAAARPGSSGQGPAAAGDQRREATTPAGLRTLPFRRAPARLSSSYHWVIIVPRRAEGAFMKSLSGLAL